MSVNLELNGVRQEIITEYNFMDFLKSDFRSAFDLYLKENYGITEEDFRKIIRDTAPEHFI